MLSFVSDRRCHGHCSNGPETPARWTTLDAVLRGRSGWEELINDPDDAVFKPSRAVQRIHTIDYLKTTVKACENSTHVCTDEVAVHPPSMIACQASVQSVLTAIDNVCGQPRAFSFCNVRPPGHHAQKDTTSGFCVFNQVAAGALYALDMYPKTIRRVAIWDYDGHYPDGTVDVLKAVNVPTIALFSVHQRYAFPNTLMSNKTAHDFDNVHLRSLKSGCSRRVYWNAFDSLYKSLVEYDPDMIMISCGFDSCIQDKLTNIQLPVTPVMFKEMTVRLLKSCPRVVSVLEGGYHLDSIAHCLNSHLCGAEEVLRSKC